MQQISNFIYRRYKRKLESRNKRRVNFKWEKASEFGKYVGLSTTFVLKLFREFGQENVLGLRSDLRDIECDRKRFPGLVYFKLRQL